MPVRPRISFNHRPRRLIGLLFAWLLLSACNTTEQQPTGPSNNKMQRGVSNEQIQDAKRQLALRTGSKMEHITLLRAGTVTWRSGAMGCPEPGMMYTQALVPGYQILLKQDGVTYHYHGARNKAPVYCAKPSKTPPLLDNSL